VRRRYPYALLAFAALLSLSVAGGCGEEEELEVKEGEPVELGELRYNVQLTRFLNRDDREDREYLVGEPEAPQGKDYLAVFMSIENAGDEPTRIPEAFEVEDTRGNAFEPEESESPFALQLGAEIPGDSELPAPDTAAASGPIKGSMILFLVDEGVTENRPLELIIPSPEGDDGRVEIDI
jgi:hypothetical protein